MKKSLLICLLAITAITTRAQDNDLVIAEDATNQIAYATFKTDKNGNRISNSYSGDVVIPEKSPSGYPVTVINHHTFEGCVNLKSVKIPGTVKFIDHDAFRKSSLTEITIPASVDSISEGVFFEMPSLKKVIIEDGPSVLRFACGQQYGGEGQFSFKHQAIEEAYIGRTFTTTWGSDGHLDAPLFEQSETLKKVTLGDQVKTINFADFYWCSNLEVVNFGKGIQTIEGRAFYQCTKLSAIDIIDGVESIGKEAFYNCKSAKSLTLPNTLKTIGWGAFKNCESVTELTIPANVTKIEDEAFLYTKSLKKVTIADGTGTLHFGYGMQYGGEGMFTRQPITEAYIGRNTTSDANGLFRNNETLLKATVGGDCTEVPNYLFRYCYALEKASLGKGVSRIGNNAFESCKKLNSLEGYPTLKFIGDNAFYDCSAIVSIDFSNDPLEEIGVNAFCNCNNIVSVSLPATLKSIGSDAFDDNKSLKQITCLATVPPACGNSGVFYHVNKEQCKLLVPEGSIDAYKAAEVWKEFFNIEPTGINRVEADASAAEWYSINGQRSSSARKGLNIMRTADGKTRKVIVR